MTIYHYNEQTGAYLGESVAEPDPLAPGAYLIPAHATAVAPKRLPANWNGQEWIPTEPPIVTTAPADTPTPKPPKRTRKKRE